MNIIQQIHYEIYGQKQFPEDEDVIEFLSYATASQNKHFNLILDTSEDVGEDSFIIFQYKDKYYRINYGYQSHYGVKYYGNGDNAYEVWPKEVKKIEYSSTKQ